MDGDVTGMLGVERIALLRVIDGLRLEEGCHGHLGVDNDAAPGAEVDDHVGALARIVTGSHILLHEMDALKHAGGLDQPSQMRLSPATPNVGSAQCGRQLARLSAQNLSRRPDMTQLLADLGAQPDLIAAAQCLSLLEPAPQSIECVPYRRKVDCGSGDRRCSAAAHSEAHGERNAAHEREEHNQNEHHGRGGGCL